MSDLSRFFCSRLWPRLLVAGLVLALAACSPRHNWRLARLDGVPLQALMPCKPDSAQREVPLWGPTQAPVRLHMASCSVGEHTFAVAALPLAAAGGVAHSPAQAEQAWRLAGWASLRQTVLAPQGVPAGWAAQPASVAGALGAQRWQGPGLNHLGQALQVQWLLAHNGRWLVQAALYGPPLSADLAQTFFDGLRLD